MNAKRDARMRRRLPPDGATLVLAVSGGADSMALWDLCVRLGRWKLVVWHLDHGLRPDAAEDGALLVRQAAAYRAAGFAPGVLAIEHADIPALAARWGMGIEAAGRRHRYERLVAVARAMGGTVVCTAHHRDDQAETVLANLLRGAGPIGLMGIAPRRALAPGIAVVRPLLAHSRDDLRNHLVEHGIAWREDSTNTDETFLRNRLRRRVLPALEALAPRAGEALARLANNIRRATRDQRRMAARLWRGRGASFALGLSDLRIAEPEVRRFVFRNLLLHLEAPLERQHLDRLERLAFGPVGKRLHLGRWLLRRGADALTWEEASPMADTSTVAINGPGEWTRGDQRLLLTSASAPTDPRADGRSAWLAASVSPPFTWRVPIIGERWRPLGSAGTQTVSKTLAERGVPSRRRPLMPLLADAFGPLWIPGVAVAERARVEPGCATAWRLTLEDVGTAATVPPMPHPTVSAVILAAGKGTRMGSDLAKVLHPLAGRPLVSHVLGTCKALGVGQSVVVVGHQREAVEAVVKPLGADTAVQDKQLGTGHAVLVTKPVVRGDTVVVLCGDCPMTPPSLLDQVLAKHRASKAACTAVAARMADPGKYGRMITDPATGRLARIVEWKDASEAERAVNLINSGIYAFNAADLWRCLERVKPNNAQGEYYLTDVIGMLVAEGRPVELVVTDDMASVLGVNTPVDLAEAEQLFSRRATA